jgi:hypothetical protein
LSTAFHRAFAEMPWPFAYAEMPGWVKCKSQNLPGQIALSGRAI